VSPGENLIEMMEQDDSVREKLGIASTMGWTAGVILALLQRSDRIEATA
jgi:hypothetical protein